MPELYLGLEIGGTKLQAGLGTADGSPLAVRRAAVDLPRGAAGVRESLLFEARQLLHAHNLDPRKDLAAVGVGFGGPVDVRRGLALRSHQVQGWNDFPLADWLRAELGVQTVAVENDADAAGLAEAIHGAGRDRDPVAYLTLGSGIGGALVRDRQLVRGRDAGFAMEIGHLPMPPDDLPLQEIASGWALGRAARARFLESETLRDLADGDPENVDAEILGLAAGLEDPVALHILDHATGALARALAALVLIANPERIVLGGGVAQLGDDLLFQPLRKKIPAHLPEFAIPPRDILQPAKLQTPVVLHGAIEAAKRARLQQSPA